MRRTFEHELPPADSGLPEHELRAKLRQVTANIRPALQNVILFLGRSLGADLEDGAVLDDQAARRATSERLRRDVWMFAQIARAFASKARHTDAATDTWVTTQNLSFVREFLGYFRAMGYPLLRMGDYARIDDFMVAMNGLADADLLDPARLEAAAAECEAFHGFLTDLFNGISQREELGGSTFDRQAAARALKLYLGA
jgi:hypothetical protein